MRKITKPHLPDERHYIFTEGINYFKTGKESIFGAGDKFTLDFLEKAKIQGKWLNLAAGDGRYNLQLLQKADAVVAADIDESALSKLWHATPPECREKLENAVFDITKRFPFANNSFDGVFCTAALYVVPKKILTKIVKEINRVLKPNGRVIFDFATDIKRVRLDGLPYPRIPGEPQYNSKSAKETINSLFKNYKFSILESKVPEEVYLDANPPYIFSSNVILFVGEKIASKDF